MVRSVRLQDRAGGIMRSLACEEGLVAF